MIVITSSLSSPTPDTRRGGGRGNHVSMVIVLLQIEDVKSSPVPINAGYSTDELKLHMDLVYYASPPGMQALHCLK